MSVHRLQIAPKVLIGTPGRVLKVLNCLEKPIQCHLLWIEEANGLLRRKGRGEVWKVIGELEGEEELGRIQRFGRIQGMVMTCSRMNRDVQIMAARLPLAQQLDELPLLLSAERLVKIQQIVKWVEPPSRRKQTLRLLRELGCEGGRKATVRVHTQEQLQVFERKLARLPTVSVTLGNPSEDCSLLLYAAAPHYNTYEHHLAHLRLPATAVLLVSAEDEALFPQLRLLLRRCDALLSLTDAVKNVVPKSWR